MDVHNGCRVHPDAPVDLEEANLPPVPPVTQPASTSTGTIRALAAAPPGLANTSATDYSLLDSSVSSRLSTLSSVTGFFTTSLVPDIASSFFSWVGKLF